MIITVTLNPAIDKTIDVNQLEPGGVNRIQHVEMDAGGKGINVSKTIHALGGQSIAMGFLGGNTGKVIDNVLKDLEIQTDFIWVDGESRTNTKVIETINGAVTELNEPGPAISEENIKTLLEKIESYAKEDTLFVLAGSIPAGVDKDLYATITNLVHKKGAKVLLDADGELFKRSIIANPDMIKPNQIELAEYANLDKNMSVDDLVMVGKKFVSNGIGEVVVSLGADGSIMILKEGVYRCQGLKVKAHSTVGAGDALVAALAYSYDMKLEIEDKIKTCIATSAGAVTTIGTKPPSKKLLDELKTKVIFEKIGE